VIEVTSGLRINDGWYAYLKCEIRPRSGVVAFWVRKNELEAGHKYRLTDGIPLLGSCQLHCSIDLKLTLLDRSSE
jgi:hypothetical protein